MLHLLRFKARVKGFVTHPITGNEALTFLEDDSIVEVRMCKKVKVDQDKPAI